MWQEICIFHKAQTEDTRLLLSLKLKNERPGKLNWQLVVWLSSLPAILLPRLSLNSNINQFIIKRTGRVDNGASQKQENRKE